MQTLSVYNENTYKVLNKNLNFVPILKQYNQKQLDTDTENFIRLLKLRARFKDANETQTLDQLYEPFKVKNKAKWTPKETHHILKTFIDLVQHDINEIKIKKVKNPKSILLNGEQEAMKHHAKRRDIIITTADKGGTVVTMILKIASKKLIANYPIKIITKYNRLHFTKQ